MTAMSTIFTKGPLRNSDTYAIALVLEGSNLSILCMRPMWGANRKCRPKARSFWHDLSNRFEARCRLFVAVCFCLLAISFAWP